MFASVLWFWFSWLLQNNVDLSALIRHGTQGELATHLADPFFHPQQTKAFVLLDPALYRKIESGEIRL